MAHTKNKAGKRKLLIIGASGLLGRRLYKYFLKKDLYKTVGTCLKNNANDLLKLDIRDRAGMQEIFDETHPDIVIHSAGLTNVDYCELNAEKANSVNVLGTINVIESCRKSDSKLIYMSTDFVFDGSGNGGYKEIDMPAKKPLNYYAQTKLHSEELIQSAYLEHLIIRTSTLYSVNSMDFVNWAISELLQGKHIRAAYNHVRSPTFVGDIPKAIDTLINDGLSGIYHVAGSRAMSKYMMAFEIAEIFGLDEKLIMAIDAKLLMEKAARPMNTSLCIKKIECEGIKMMDFKEGLFEILTKK